MKTKVFTDVIFENGKYAVNLDTNYSIAKIKVTLDADGQEQSVDVKVEYAQNRVTSDLILFADVSGKTGDFLELVSGIPVSASDIYVTLSKSEIVVGEVELFIVDEADIAEYYPLYKDVDLKKNYYLDTITVFTPAEGYSQYTLYTSINDRDFDEVARKTSKDSCPESGEVYYLNGKEARIIRVYIEYNSESPEAVLDKIEFTGKESGTPIENTPKIDIQDFKDSIYNVELTDDDIYEEVYGIIERNIGIQYRSWFDLELVNDKEYDYFEINDKDKKICVTGNNGISLATGVNYYLKYFCNVNISQVGNQTKMPSSIIAVGKTVHKETKARLRYVYNYCTHSYSMAFWGEKEWRKEIDWLALNGVNLVLDITAQEEVWRRFLSDIGYAHSEIKKFITGPAFYAWAYMGNHTGFGGPVHDSWFEERTELARKNQLIMRKLGMQPILQGYSGMVPVDICDYDKNADVIPQGIWNTVRRPDMLRTTSDCFKKYAHKFYKAQKEVYGNVTDYFAIDPFHEGGITLDMSPREISREILSAMLRENPNSVWIIQSWEGNPTSELLSGLEDVKNGKKHALILDLYAEKRPNYLKGKPDAKSYGYDVEFNHTPWLYCMLNNFGGRLGLHGHLDNLVREIPKVLNKCTSFAGIGITPEASENNPVLYEFFFESVWCDDASSDIIETDIAAWLKKYTLRRYGRESENVNKAWNILKDTVYKSELNMLGQGAPECVVNARPSLYIKAASTWGNAVISYDKALLKEAKELLVKDYDALKESEGYLYDVIAVIQQVLSNDAQDLHEKMVLAFKEGNIEEFEAYSEDFLKLIDKMDKVTGSSEYYLLGRWVKQAKELAKNADDLSKRLYEFNAKVLITTLGGYVKSEIGGIHDYSNRQWSGLIGDFYKKRWQMWINARRTELKGETFENIDWYAWEWEWARKTDQYDALPIPIDISAF